MFVRGRFPSMFFANRKDRFRRGAVGDDARRDRMSRLRWDVRDRLGRGFMLCDAHALGDDAFLRRGALLRRKEPRGNDM